MNPATALDVRSDFPFLTRTVNGKPLAYLDIAATTQKPSRVLQVIHDLYSSGLSNVHRAVNFLAAEVTDQFEESRSTIASFLGAHSREIVFVQNSTHAINLVANGLARGKTLRVLTTTLEHHSNLLPWNEHAEIDLIPWSPAGLDLDALEQKLRTRPDLVAIAQASNFLGVVHPIHEITRLCRKYSVPILIDASQSIAHLPADVRESDCDYLVFSGHKMYGPSGTGILYVRNELIDNLRPLLVGGAMVKEVHARTFVMNDAPYRFEAGTPNIEGFIGLAAAVRYISDVGYDRIACHEQALVRYARRELSRISGLQVYGPPLEADSAPLVAFEIRGLDPGAIAKALAARANVIVRSGFHCAQPAHEQLGIEPTVRASFGIYNNIDEIDSMLDVLRALTRFLH